MTEVERKRVLGAGRVAFLALRETIAKELAEGWSMAEVFRRHQNRLGIQVAQFRSYVTRYISADQLWTARPKSAPVAASPNTPSSPPPISKPPPAPPSDPLRRITRSINLKREDLI